MKFIFDSISQESADIFTLRFTTDKPLRYEAGQFVELTIPHKNPDDRGERRWFTLSSSPTEKFVTITTRNFDKDASSFKKSLFSLRLGEHVKASEAMGDFVLPKDKGRPLLFVAGGIGITPMRSMAKFLADKKQTRDITLLYAASDTPHIVFSDVFEQIGAKVIPLVSTETAQRLSAEFITQYAKNNCLIYVSGPEPMTEYLVEELKNLGIKESQLVTDYFPGYSNEYALQRA